MPCFLLTCHYLNQHCVNMVTSWHGIPLYNVNLSSFFDISQRNCWTNTQITSDPKRSYDVFIISPMRSSAFPFPANVMGYDQKIQHWTSRITHLELQLYSPGTKELTCTQHIIPIVSSLGWQLSIIKDNAEYLTSILRLEWFGIKGMPL